MNQAKQIIPLFMLALAACTLPPEAYTNRGDPERLLSIVTEVTHVSIESQDDVETVNDMIERDRPVRATLDCDADEKYCKRMRTHLTRKAIPLAEEQGGDGVSLVYERIMARDCDNRYVDNSSNPYNLNMSNLGCSITGNMAQMVSDKKQFTNPSLLDFQDGEKTAQAYDKYLQPSAQEDSSSSGGGSGSIISGGSTQ